MSNNNMLWESPADITLLVRKGKTVHKSVFIPHYSIATFEANEEDLIREFRQIAGFARCKIKRGNTRARRLLISGTKNAVDVVILRAMRLVSLDRTVDHLKGCIQSVCIELLLTVTTVV